MDILLAENASENWVIPSGSFNLISLQTIWQDLKYTVCECTRYIFVDEIFLQESKTSATLYCACHQW